MYAETKLGDTETRLNWIEADRAAFEASDDPFIRLAVVLYNGDREREAEQEAEAGEFQAARSRYMETMLAFLGSRGESVYPDANSSLRVTFGNVRGYQPRDGILYTPFTKIEGIREKHTGEDPFDSLQSQLDLIEADAEIVPGLRSRVTGGHTRGHQALVFTSGGQTAVYPGDLCPMIAHVRQMWGMGFDTHPLQTRRNKPQLLGEAADGGWWILWDHDPDVAVSRLARDEKQEFVAVEARETL